MAILKAAFAVKKMSLVKVVSNNSDHTHFQALLAILKPHIGHTVNRYTWIGEGCSEQPILYQDPYPGPVGNFETQRRPK